MIAVALTPVLPAGLPVLAALAGLATGWRPRGGTRRAADDSARAAHRAPRTDALTGER